MFCVVIFADPLPRAGWRAVAPNLPYQLMKTFFLSVLRLGLGITLACLFLLTLYTVAGFALSSYFERKMQTPISFGAGAETTTTETDTTATTHH